MMDILAFLGWFVVNVGVPVFGPIALLPLLKFPRSFQSVSQNVVRNALIDGQLFWTVIAMCAGAIYELIKVLYKSPAIDESLKVGLWIGLLWHFFVVLVSAVLVLLGTLDTLQSKAAMLTQHAPALADQSITPVSTSATDPRLLEWSIYATILTAVTFSLVHVVLPS